MQLETKIAVTAGGTTDIGRATAGSLLKQGIKKSIVTAHDQSRSETARVESLKNGTWVIALQLRAEMPEDSTASIEKIHGELGQLDVGLANASGASPTPLGRVKVDAAQAQFAANFIDPQLLLQALSVLLRGGTSVILSTSSSDVLGKTAITFHSAAKAADRSTTRTLSVESDDRDICENAMVSGQVETPINDKLGISDQDSTEISQAVLAKVPAERFGRPEEIGSAVTFLTSDGSSFMREVE